jgi:hypothetical protein
MSLQDDIRAAMEIDETLAELLTGGIHTGVEITRQEMPGAFDEVSEILPCALVKAPTTVPTGPYIDSARTTIQIYFYQRAGTEVIGSAMRRTVALLNGSKPRRGMWQMNFADQVEDARDDGLECSLGVARFWAVRKMMEEAEDEGS